MVGEPTFERYAKHIAVAVVVLLILLPVYWMVNMSLKDRAEFAARPPTLIVEQPTTANYYDLLVTQRFYLKGRNSLVDGDSRFAVLRKIALPLVAPGLAATFILVFISSWNEFLVALILTGSRAQTLPIAVAGQIGQYDVQWGNMMAAGVITTIPVLILALLTQRYLTRGLAVGGVTG